MDMLHLLCIMVAYITIFIGDKESCVTKPGVWTSQGNVHILRHQASLTKVAEYHDNMSLTFSPEPSRLSTAVLLELGFRQLGFQTYAA